MPIHAQFLAWKLLAISTESQTLTFCTISNGVFLPRSAALTCELFTSSDKEGHHPQYKPHGAPRSSTIITS